MPTAQPKRWRPRSQRDGTHVDLDRAVHLSLVPPVADSLTWTSVCSTRPRSIRRATRTGSSTCGPSRVGRGVAIGMATEGRASTRREDGRLAAAPRG